MDCNSYKVGDDGHLYSTRDIVLSAIAVLNGVQDSLDNHVEADIFSFPVTRDDARARLANSISTAIHKLARARAQLVNPVEALAVTQERAVVDSDRMPWPSRSAISVDRRPSA